MRVPICYEGKETVKGQLITPGALTWSDDPIPISVGSDWSKPPIGYATDLRREDDGTITAEVPDLDILSNEWGLSIWANETIEGHESTEDLRVVDSGHLRAVFWSTDIPWNREGLVDEWERRNK